MDGLSASKITLSCVLEQHVASPLTVRVGLLALAKACLDPVPQAEIPEGQNLLLGSLFLTESAFGDPGAEKGLLTGTVLSEMTVADLDLHRRHWSDCWSR